MPCERNAFINVPVEVRAKNTAEKMNILPKPSHIVCFYLLPTVFACFLFWYSTKTNNVMNWDEKNMSINFVLNAGDGSKLILNASKCVAVCVLCEPITMATNAMDTVIGTHFIIFTERNARWRRHSRKRRAKNDKEILLKKKNDVFICYATKSPRTQFTAAVRNNFLRQNWISILRGKKPCKRLAFI